MRAQLSLVKIPADMREHGLSPIDQMMAALPESDVDGDSAYVDEIDGPVSVLVGSGASSLRIERAGLSRLTATCAVSSLLSDNLSNDEQRGAMSRGLVSILVSVQLVHGDQKHSEPVPSSASIFGV